MIREANCKDLLIINDLVKELDNHQINLKDPFTYYYIYYEDKEIKGFISYAIIYDRCELNYILIKPEYRKQGIASKLMEYIINDCLNHNCYNITLEVNENNKEAISLYSKYGFKKVAVRKNYYGKNNGILMERVLEDKWEIHIY